MRSVPYSQGAPKNRKCSIVINNPNFVLQTLIESPLPSKIANVLSTIQNSSYLQQIHSSKPPHIKEKLKEFPPKNENSSSFHTSGFNASEDLLEDDLTNEDLGFLDEDMPEPMAGSSQIPSNAFDSNESSQENCDGYINTNSVRFIGNVKNDALDTNLQREDFNFSAELFNGLHDIFGITKFRPNQLESVNAAMLKNDCFILMPTGMYD